MRLRASVRYDLGNHSRVKLAIWRGDGPVKEVLDEYERLYRAFILDRFDRYSMGGGDWRRLNPRTVARKRKNKNLILVHTRFMRLKLDKGIKIKKRDRAHVTLGFDMGMLHPDTGVTVERLAEIHDLGLGVPKRKILVLPDDKTRKLMREAAGRILAGAMRGER